MGRLRDPGEEEKGRDPGQRVRFRGVPGALGEKGGAGCSEEGPPPGRAAAPPAPPPGRRPRSSCPSGLGGRTGSEPSSPALRPPGLPGTPLCCAPVAMATRPRAIGRRQGPCWPVGDSGRAGPARPPRAVTPARFRRSGFLEFNCKGLRGETRAY